MDQDEGLTFALSPVQVTAIVNHSTVSRGETISNRLWGGLGMVSGIVEIFGAGILCIVPEPTMMTKAGCIIVGTHSLDTINASLKQVLTGQKNTTATEQLARKAFLGLGVNTEIAYVVGVTVDLAIPFAFASMAGAVRVASVYAGRINLLEHEGSSLGHSIARHVGQTPEQLIARLSGGSSPVRASSFRNIKEAEKLITDVLSTNSHRIKTTIGHMLPESKLPLEKKFSRAVGTYIDKGSTEIRQAHTVRVIIKARKFNNKLYFIVTAYPAP